MSYEAKKGMTRKKSVDGGYVYMFQDPGTPPGPPAKSWFHVEVTRRVFDSKGEVVKKNKQTTTVFGSESSVIGLAMRRCPDPWPGTSDEVKVNVYSRPLAGDEGL